jgi:hypothetical protein
MKASLTNNNKQQNKYKENKNMSTLTIGRQVAFTDGSERKGAIVALEGETATVRLRGSDETVTAALADLKGTRGRPSKVAAPASTEG